jgi:hypothetical protein
MTKMDMINMFFQNIGYYLFKSSTFLFNFVFDIGT